MIKLNRKIQYALFILIICLVAFIGFSKAGILFSASNNNIITVSTNNNTFVPNKYVASVANLNKRNNEATTTTEETTVKSTTTTTTTTVTTTQAFVWNGDVLSKSKGVVQGPTGRETYYNLDMTSVINSMRNMGFSENEYPYWVREDGVKMLGSYVIVAANYGLFPKGTYVQSSLGLAIVCDTGGFAQKNPTQLDIAVTW